MIKRKYKPNSKNINNWKFLIKQELNPLIKLMKKIIFKINIIYRKMKIIK